MSDDPHLKRMEQQSEKLFAPDSPAAEEDRIEVLGRRIGRALSVVLALVLIWYLWTMLA
jgi:hypothetical protein